MPTQLTLITVPAATAVGPTASDEPAGDGAATEGTATRDAAVLPHRRSADHTGWLDRRTISTGRRGVARARAALADATRRAAVAEAERASTRGAALARAADRFTGHPGSHDHAA
ncbi:MAG: hypothetical protein JST64_12705 [Actinobacteria bacterium]|nr:hypothetical protein [Actinomycetota bacterium]